MVNLSGSTTNPTETLAGVIVNDGRTDKSSTWTLSVAQSTPISDSTWDGVSYQTNPDGTTNLFKPVWKPKTGGIDLSSGLTYLGTQIPVSGSGIVVGKEDTSLGNSQTVIKRSSTDFKLTVPAAEQSPTAQYHGQLTWTLTTAP